MAPPPAVAVALEHDLENDPVWLAFKNAPVGEDNLTAEERAQVEQAIDDVRAGRVEMVSHDDVRAELARRRARGE